MPTAQQVNRLAIIRSKLGLGLPMSKREALFETWGQWGPRGAKRWYQERAREELTVALG